MDYSKYHKKSIGEAMFSPMADSMFIIPVCYHPTTILSVDDDMDFLKLLSMQMYDKLSFLCFDSPEKALDYAKSYHDYNPFIERCTRTDDSKTTFNFSAIRNEIYNADRFKEICISVTDYDMPYKDGIELIRTLEFKPEISQYTNIILTGKISDEFKEKLVGLGLSGEYIGKDDPQYINKLLDLIENRLARIFQTYSYMPARALSNDPEENTSCFFDGGFAKILNKHIKDNNVCELYLFDKQGSYLFLDKDANLSWMFVRNDTGIENSVKLAKQYSAPKAVIQALEDKSHILSLYENEDFKIRKEIDWDKYLLPAKVFETDGTYLNFFSNLVPASSNGEKKYPKYYYAFSSEFPDNGIKKDQILSYEQFLRDS
tara:strand:+ start:400 stop:1518 length:1119 start_codon:yes stop_codon:yes gene_type:complete